MKSPTYLGRIPTTLHQVDVLLHVPHFVAAGNREAAFHLRQALAYLAKAVRVHRGLAPYQTDALPDLVFGNGTTIQGLPADDPWRERFEPFLSLELPRSRVRDRRDEVARKVSTETIQSATERLRNILPLAAKEIGAGRLVGLVPSKRSIVPPISMWRASRA